MVIIFFIIFAIVRSFKENGITFVDDKYCPSVPFDSDNAY